MSPSKITAASQASDRILSELDAARRLIVEPIAHNGFGVIVDPGEVRRQIRAAHERLTTALDLLETTTWPTRLEYEDAET